MVNVPETDTICHAVLSPIFKYICLKSFVLLKFYLAQWLESVLYSTFSVYFYLDSAFQCFCYCARILTVSRSDWPAGQISLPPVFSCDAHKSAWKEQDQGQSLAVCLWNRENTNISSHGTTLIDRSCLNQYLWDFLVQVNHLAMLLKCRIWFNELGVGSEILHLQQAPSAGTTVWVARY